MPLYVLDTDAVSLLREGHAELRRRLASVPLDQRATTVITVEGILTGWYTAVRKATRPERIESTYRQLGEAVTFFAAPILPFPLSAISRFEALKKQ